MTVEGAECGIQEIIENKKVRFDDNNRPIAIDDIPILDEPIADDDGMDDDVADDELFP